MLELSQKDLISQWLTSLPSDLKDQLLVVDGKRLRGVSTPQQFADWIREHWLIENPLHYVLDLVFKEDAFLADIGHIAENMSIFRRLTMNVIKTFDPKRGMADARRGATYKPKYLLGLLSRLFSKKC